MVIASGGTAILDSVYSEPIPDFLLALVITPALICMLVVGGVMIKRQECPRIMDPSITGFGAVVIGCANVFGAVFCFIYLVFTLVNS